MIKIYFLNYLPKGALYQLNVLWVQSTSKILRIFVEKTRFFWFYQVCVCIKISPLFFFLIKIRLNSVATKFYLLIQFCHKTGESQIRSEFNWIKSCENAAMCIGDTIALG